MTLLLILTHRKKIHWHVILLTIVFASILGLGVYDKINDYMTKREGFNVRIEMMKVGLEMIKEKPVLGFGLNTSVIHLPKYDLKNVTIGYPIHNHYLILASEVGVIGLGGWLVFNFFILRSAILSMQTSSTLRLAVLSGIVAGYCGIALHMGWDHFGDEVIQTMLWIFAGIVMAIERMPKETKTQRYPQKKTNRIVHA